MARRIGFVMTAQTSKTKCPECGKAFTTEAAYKKHRKVEHAEIKSNKR